MQTSKWSLESIQQIYDLPLLKLLANAQSAHQQNFPEQDIELCTLSNIKQGGCPENCAYCNQSIYYKTDVKAEKLLSLSEVIEQAKRAKAQGARRFCMGAAWRSPPKRGFERVLNMIQEVKALGLKSCVTLGLLDDNHAKRLKEVGLDYYNHNLDTSPEYYKKIITTRSYEDRLKTLTSVHNAGIKICCGVIFGMGETRNDRVAALFQLLQLPEEPESVPINRLIPMANTPLAKISRIDNLEFVRAIAVARILMPKTMLRLSGERYNMSEEMQTLCFMAGANSIFIGEKLLTVDNAELNKDKQLLSKLGMKETV